MSPEAQKQLAKTASASQGPNGFFVGRAGQEDLYYTFFGLLLAAVTRAKFQWKKCDAKLHSVDFETLDLVHACAWLRATKIVRWFSVPSIIWPLIPIVSLRSDTKRLQFLSNLSPQFYPQQDAGSPYSRFLLSTLHSDFAATTPTFDLTAYRLPNNLYANLQHHTAYGINATAAALFLLAGSDPTLRSGIATADALAALQETDGSFKATASAPEGDLMSTATAAFALQHYGKSLAISVKPFLRECFRENAFFAATPNDPDGDLEYTTYGLLLMGAEGGSE